MAIGPRGSHGAPSAATCVGRLRITPGAVHIGGAFKAHGSGFTCRAADGRLFQAAVIMYQPRLGFAIFTSAVSASGRYTITLRMPRTLTSVAVLQGHPYRSVATKPGTYYFTVRLADVYLPPPADALAHVRVER